MADLTDILLLINLATGEFSYDVYANWGEVADANFAFIEDALGEVTSKTVTTADVTLIRRRRPARSFIKLLAARSPPTARVIAPDRKGFWFVTERLHRRLHPDLQEPSAAPASWSSTAPRSPPVCDGTRNVLDHADAARGDLAPPAS